MCNICKNAKELREVYRIGLKNAMIDNNDRMRDVFLGKIETINMLLSEN